MANLSEWIERAESVERGEPTWLASLRMREGFRAGTPFSAAAGEPCGRIATDPATPATSNDQPADDALAKAFAEGEAAGRDAAHAEAMEELERKRAIRLAFRALDQAAMDSLASELSETVIALCEPILGAGTVDRDRMIGRCAEAARRLGSAAGQMTLRLHPDDLELIGSEAIAGCTVQADRSVERGGLVLEGSDGSVHDGPTEWRRAISQAVRG